MLAKMSGAIMDVAYLECLQSPPNRTPEKIWMQLRSNLYYLIGLRDFYHKYHLLTK